MCAAVSEPLPPPLLAAPAPPPDTMNAEGEGATPLMYACQQARDADVKALLAKKVFIMYSKFYIRRIYKAFNFYYTIGHQSF